MAPGIVAEWHKVLYDIFVRTKLVGLIPMLDNVIMSIMYGIVNQEIFCTSRVRYYKTLRLRI